MTDKPLIRWHAVITYRTDAGPVAVEHDLEELFEIDDMVERGPHWDTVENIIITRVNHNTASDLTVDAAAKL